MAAGFIQLERHVHTGLLQRPRVDLGVVHGIDAVVPGMDEQGGWYPRRDNDVGVLFPGGHVLERLVLAKKGVRDN